MSLVPVHVYQIFSKSSNKSVVLCRILFYVFVFCFSTCVLKIPLYQIVPFTGYYVHLIASLNETTSLTIKKSIIKTPEGRALLRAVLIFNFQSRII